MRPITPARHEWKHFIVSVLTMGSLGIATVWRNVMTTGPMSDRYYFFPNDTWIGRIDRRWLGDVLKTIDHSWLNDFLLGPGTVACFYMAFTVLYAIGGLLSPEARPSSLSARPPLTNDSCWSNHKRRMEIILYVILGGMLYSGWAEEVQLLPSPFIFDVKDVVVEGAGVLLGFWMIQALSYPLFSCVPRFASSAMVPDPRRLAPKFAIDVAAVFVGAAYTWIVDPFALSPLTLHQQWTLPFEFSLVFLAVRRALQHAFAASSEHLLLHL